MARARRPDLRAQRPQRIVAGVTGEPAADLDDRQHAARTRAAARPASAAAGAASRSAALHGISTTVAPEALRRRPGEERARAER